MSESLEEKVDRLRLRVQNLTPENVTRPTLVYFDIIGIGWPIRCLMHLHNLDYDYIPISIQEWAYRDSAGKQVLKGAFCNGHVPLYVDSDVTLNQSNLILAYLARQVNMMGDSDQEALAIQEITAHCYDALFHWNGMLQITIRSNISDEVAQTRLDSFMGSGVWGLVTNGYRNHLDTFVKYLSANAADSGYLVGNRLSIADLHAFNVLCNWYKAFDRSVFSSEYPELDAYIQRIAAIPGVTDYIKKIQESTTWFTLPQIALRLTSEQELHGLVSLP